MKASSFYTLQLRKKMIACFLIREETLHIVQSLCTLYKGKTTAALRLCILKLLNLQTPKELSLTLTHAANSLRALTSTARDTTKLEQIMMRM